MSKLYVNEEGYEFDTFICYRGRSTGVEIGKDIASDIYDCVSHHSEFGLVFFAEKMNFTYNFISHAKPIIGSVKRFIIILTNNFFADFYTEKDGIVKGNEQSATYVELKYAFQYGCEIFPIFSSEFRWKNIDAKELSCLSTLFGNEKFKELRNRSNVLQWTSHGRTEDEIIKYLNTPQAKSDDDAYFRFNKAMLDTEAECTKISKKQYMIYNQLMEKTLELSIDNLEMDFGAYQSLKDSNDKMFHIPSGYIYGVRALQTNRSFSFLGKGYLDVKRLCGLPEVNAYRYWNLDCCAAPKPHSEISICAICFGMLMLHSWIEHQNQNRFSNIDEGDVYETKQSIEGGIAMLLTLRDYEEFTWMSTWKFNDHGYVGTLNQTTLSLSTLLRCGFLSASDIKQSYLEKRFLYINDSVQFLLNMDLAKDNHFRRMYWGETSNNKEIVSYAQTCFCFDVFSKYCIQIILAKASFTNKFLRVMDVVQTQMIDSLDKIINQFEIWVKSWCRGHSHTRKENTHINDLSRILVSLCELRKAVNKIDSAIVYESGIYKLQDERTENMIRYITEYLLEMEHTQFSKISKDEVFEKFAFIKRANWKLWNQDNHDEYEYYENCTELLYMNALLEALNYASDEMREQLINKIIGMIRWFEAKYEEKKGGRIVIKGKRPKGDIEYPLYALYYYSVVLRKYLQLMEAL